MLYRRALHQLTPLLLLTRKTCMGLLLLRVQILMKRIVMLATMK